MLYAAATRWRRRYASNRHHLHRPVVSIGNIAVGGRAKTPMTELVARILLDAGERPAILSRGYGRERVTDVPVVVRNAAGIRAGLAESGDEPLMLAERLDGAIVVVHPDRARGGAVAESLGATVHVLDDGFQHVQLARDIDIVMLQPSDLSEQVMPAGRMREPIDALVHADAIVILDGDSLARAMACEAVSGIPGVRTFTAVRRVAAPSAESSALPAFFVSGIAGGDQAVRAVRDAGWRIAGEQRFKDHHRYSAADAAAIARKSRDVGAAFVLTTAKDAVRLREVWTGDLALQIAELAIDIEERARFEHWLLERITLARVTRDQREGAARRDGARRAS